MTIPFLRNIRAANAVHNARKLVFVELWRCGAIGAALLLMSVCLPTWAQVVTLEAKPAISIVAPSAIAKVEDDRLCTLMWNQFPNQSDPNANGFDIQWGTASEGYVRKATTPYNIWQAQPLDIGVVYKAQIRSKDRWGRTSAWFPPDGYSFQHNGARVAAIKAQCDIPGGFVDDFNIPQGAFDPLKHNFAVSRLTDELVDMFSINSQLHAHLATVSKRWDRGKVVDKVRQLIDLSDNGTRTIYIDEDSHPDTRNTWYLDFIKADGDIAPYDLTNRITTFAGDTSASNTAFSLRLSQVATKFSVQTVGADGRFNSNKEVALDYATSTTPRLIPMPNIRRPWKFTISKTLVEAFVLDWADGQYKKVLSAPVNLQWNKARVLNTIFGYNGPKNGFLAWLWHFDNFAFDAPANGVTDPLVYNYETELHHGQEYGDNPYNVKSFTIKVPDKVANWNHALYFTVSRTDGNVSSFVAGPNNFVTVNGTNFPITLADDDLRSYRVILPPGLLKTGGAMGSGTPTPPGTPCAAIPANFALPAQYKNWGEFRDCLLSYANFADGKARESAATLLVSNTKGPSPLKEAVALDPLPDINNVITFNFRPGVSGALNIHIEATRPVGDTAALPAHSTHCDIWGCNGNMGPLTYPFGSDVTFNKVGSQEMWDWDRNQPDFALKVPIPVSGNVVCEVIMDQLSAITANGSPSPAQRIEFLVDNVVVSTTNVFSLAQDGVTPDSYAVTGRYKYTLNTSLLTNGRHEIFARAFTPAGIASNPRYFEAGSRNGEYRPVSINVQNGN